MLVDCCPRRRGVGTMQGLPARRDGIGLDLPTQGHHFCTIAIALLSPLEDKATHALDWAYATSRQPILPPTGRVSCGPAVHALVAGLNPPLRVTQQLSMRRGETETNGPIGFCCSLMQIMHLPPLSDVSDAASTHRQSTLAVRCTNPPGHLPSISFRVSE